MISKKLLATAALLATQIGTFAQHEQDYWIFGHPGFETLGSTTVVGLPITLNFNHPTAATLPSNNIAATNNIAPAPNNITLADGVSIGWEGTAVATDNITGELYFYTDGNVVYDKNHNDITPTGGLGGHNSSAQPAAISANPATINNNCSYNEYYIFSNPTSADNNGAITYRTYNRITGNFSPSTNLPLLASDAGTAPDVTEGMLIVPSSDPSDPNKFWLITHLNNSNVFRTYEISSTGIAIPTETAIGPIITSTTFSVGNFAYHPTSFRDPVQGEIAVTNSGAAGTDDVFTVLFNATTGTISSSLIIPTDPNIAGIEYDVEFSADASKLYFTTTQWVGAGGGIHQYDYSTLSLTPNIVTRNRINGIKRGPDNNIYFLFWDHNGGGNPVDIPASSTLGRLTNPNTIATDPAFASSIEMNYLNQLNVCAINFPEFLTVPEQPLCCAAAIDPTFTHVTENISTNTFWDGKVYIPDNTIIEVEDAILDITTADVVFGTCAGIRFRNNGILRANNSVFRPCNIEDTWRGIQFTNDNDENAAHIINENTFKNAEIALNFDPNTSGTINSNTFINANEAIRTMNTTFNSAIFGNNIVINHEYPRHSNCYDFTNSNAIYGIHATQSNFNANISENQFLYAYNNADFRFTGIELHTSFGNVSENKFTNNTHAISVVSANGNTTIENNEIELTSLYKSSTTPSEINIFRVQGPVIRVRGNEIFNTNYENTTTNYGIFSRFSENVLIEANTIHGFNNSISCDNSTRHSISSNTITQCANTGIYLNQSKNAPNFISCNDITMRFAQGAGIWTLSNTDNTKITSNCIKDANTGILVQTLPEADNKQIPFIRNNYIYNYSVGIQNLNHTGNIGTATIPGLNTLWSNNNTAVDVSSNTNITVGDNFGMFNITAATVSITSNNPYHSTASCGHQIFNLPSQGNLNTNYKCDYLNEVIEPLEAVDDQLNTNELQAISLLQNSKNDFEILRTVLYAADWNESTQLALMKHAEMNAHEVGLLNYLMLKKEGDYNEAITQILALDENSLEEGYVETELLLLKTLKGEVISESDILDNTNLETIYNGSADLYVAVSHNSPIHLAYQERTIEFTSTDISQFEVSRINNLVQLEVFPNPFNEQIEIRVLNGTDLTAKEILLIDVTGRIIYQEDTETISGSTTVKLDFLKPGSYFVLLKGENNSIIQQTKIVKAK